MRDFRVTAADAVILRTGWWEERGTIEDYLSDNPGLTKDAAEALLARGVGLVGIDTANIDRPGDEEYLAHHAFLRANVPIIENVANLEALGNSKFRVVAPPLRMVGVSGSSIRLVTSSSDPFLGRSGVQCSSNIPVARRKER